MADLPQPQSYEQLLSDALAAYAAKQGINDFNVGSAVTSFYEVVALMVARSSGDIFQILRDFSVDRATGDALKRLALENNVTPIAAKPATGLVSVIDSSFSKIATKIYAGANPPNVGSTLIKVSDATTFTTTGSIYLGRGTPNVEGPLPYTSITSAGSFFIITLSSATTKFHNVGESVILSQGGNRSIPINTIVISPGIGSTPDLQYSVTTSAVILDGEVEVDNVQVTATTPGAAGNIPIGAIKDFSAAPFTGATVTNPLPFTSGADNETDDQLRVRIKRAQSSIGLGTATAVQSALIGASPSDENATIVSTSLIQNTNGTATIFLDDGTGYEAKTAGVGLESIVDSALGGEQFFQLATGGRQAPVAKAFLQSTVPAPFDLIDGDTLSVVVGGITYQHVFSNSDFISPGGATAFEVTASINADTQLGFEATTSGGGQFVVLRAKTEGNDSLKTTTPTTSGRDATVLLGLPSNQIETLRLYKNNLPLSKDGKVASVFTQSQQLWSATITNGDTLVLAVDGTAAITYTILDTDFLATGLYTNVAATNTLAAWAQVLNAKLTGVTVDVVGTQLEIVSNLGASNRARVVVDASSTLVTKGMFSSVIGLSSQGAASDFTLSRNTAQFELVVPLVAGDKLSAGDSETEARIQSAQIPGGSITFSGNAHIWLLIDAPGQLINTGVIGNTLLTVTAPLSNTIRYLSSAAGSFNNVQVGDYIIVWSDELNVNNRIEGRVHAKTSTTVDILITPTEYAAIVPEANIVFNDGFVVLRTDRSPQKFKIAAGTFTLDQIAQAFQAQTTNLIFTVFQEEFLVIRTRTKDLTGALLAVTADTEGKLLSLPIGNSDVSKDSLIAFYDSGQYEGQFPLFIHAGFAAGSAADPIDSYIGSFLSTTSLSGRDPNEIICLLYPYGTIKDTQPFGENAQETTITGGTTIGITQKPDIRRIRNNDRYYIASPLDFGYADTTVVVLDNDASAKSYEIPFFRRAITNTSLAVNPTNFNAYDTDSGPTAQFPIAFGANFDFSNFKALMQAKKVLKPTPTKTALLYRSTRWGRSGEYVTVGYDYPSAPNLPIGSTVTVTSTADIRINLVGGAAVPTAIDPTTQWNVTITANTPSVGIDQVTYTWSGIGTSPNLIGLLGGEYVNISAGTGFSTANKGIFRVSTQGGFTPTATAFSVQRATGSAVAESAKNTVVSGGIVFYSAAPTLASAVKAYVDANLAGYFSATIVLDGDTSGSGNITKSTFEDSGFTYDRVQLKDGINWILSSNISGSPQFIFKEPLDLPTDVGYSFNSGEEVRFIPTTQGQVNRLISVLAVTGFTTVGTVGVVDRGTRIELATDTLGSSGSIQIIGGQANMFQVPILDSAIRLDNTFMTASTDKIAAQGIQSDQWFRLQAATAQNKETLISSNTSVSAIGNTPLAGQSKVNLLGRQLNQRYFGKPRHHVRSQGDTFRLEKQGDLACLSWNPATGSSPIFKESALNFNDTSGGTINVTLVSGTSDSIYTILTGLANFNELSIGDLVTIAGLPQAANNGTFLVTGVSDDGKQLRVFNQNAVAEYSSGTFTFTANATAGDVFTVNGTTLTAGFDFVVAGSQASTETNLAAKINTLSNVSASVVINDVQIIATQPIPIITLDYLGSPTIATTGTFDLTSNVSAGDVFTVNSTNLVAGTDFAVGVTATATATNLAAAINAISGVTGSSVGSLVTVTPTSGFSLTVGYKGSPVVTVTGIYTFSGNSTQGDIFTVGVTTLIAGVSFPVGGTLQITIDNLVAVINGIAGVRAVGSPTVVTVIATTLNAIVALAYSGTPVVTVSGPFLVGDSFVAGNFSASSSVSEGDSVILQAPFSALNQGTFRVIRRYNDSIWYENVNLIEEEVTLPANPISVGYSGTTSFDVLIPNNNLYLKWNGTGTEPNLENAYVGDVVTLGTDFNVANRGKFMVLRSGVKLQEITNFVFPPGTSFPLTGNGKYFFLYSAGNTTQYYIWYNVNGTNTDPSLVGPTGIEVDILSGDTPLQIATKTGAAINVAAGADFTYTLTPATNTLTVTTTGYIETTDASNFNIPAPFTASVTQQGRRTFLEAINPSAVAQSGVLITNVLAFHRPQMQFFEYEASIPGDHFVVTGSVLTLSNVGSYNIIRVIDKDNAIVSGVLANVTNVSLNGFESAVFVSEDTLYSGYKRVYLTADQPGAATRTQLLFDTNNQYSKINQSASVEMTSLNKENFSTVIRQGLDSYRFNTGLIAEANRIVYGDPRDPATYPGVGAAGAEIFVREPLTKRVQVSIAVRLLTGVPFDQMVDQVRTSVSSLINSNPVGQPIAISAIVAAVNAISGVRALAISSPQYDSTHDLIFIAPSEKARIIDPTVDISVNQIGT